MKNKAIRETVILSVLILILYVSSAYMPLLPLISFLSALPFAYVGVRYGGRYFLGMLGVSLAALMALNLSFGALVLLMLGGVNGFALMAFIKLKKSRSFTTGGLVFVFLLSYSLIIILVQYMYSIDLLNLFETYAIAMRDDIITSMQELNATANAVDMDDLRELYTNQFDVIIFTVKTILPYIIVFCSSFSAILLVALTYYIFNRSGIALPKSGKYSEFRYEPHILWGTTIIAVLSYITININFVNSITMSYNLFFIVQLLFSVQGLSLVIFLMDKRKLSTASKTIMLILLFMLRPMMILAILGWVDAIFNFRKIGVNVE